jgi:hypothetical protein
MLVRLMTRLLQKVMLAKPFSRVLTPPGKPIPHLAFPSKRALMACFDWTWDVSWRGARWTRFKQDQRRGYKLWTTSSCTSGTE